MIWKQIEKRPKMLAYGFFFFFSFWNSSIWHFEYFGIIIYSKTLNLKKKKNWIVCVWVGWIGRSFQANLSCWVEKVPIQSITCRNQLTPHPYGSFDKLIKHFLKINYYNSHKIPIQIFKFVKNNSQIPKLFKLKVKK